MRHFSRENCLPNTLAETKRKVLKILKRKEKLTLYCNWGFVKPSSPKFAWRKKFFLCVDDIGFEIEITFSVRRNHVSELIGYFVFSHIKKLRFLFWFFQLLPSKNWNSFVVHPFVNCLHSTWWFHIGILKLTGTLKLVYVTKANLW